MFGVKNKSVDSAETTEKSETTEQVTYRPAVDVAETAAGYTIYADVPGANKDHVNVTYEDGVVTLKAESAVMRDEKSAQTIHREFRFASYERAFRVGDDVDSDAIGAEIQNGVLKVTLPRKASAKKTVAVVAK